MSIIDVITNWRQYLYVENMNEIYGDRGARVGCYVPHRPPGNPWLPIAFERGNPWWGLSWWTAGTQKEGLRVRGGRGRKKEKDGGKESWGGEVFVKAPYIGSVAHVTTPAVSTPRVSAQKSFENQFPVRYFPNSIVFFYWVAFSFRIPAARLISDVGIETLTFAKRRREKHPFNHFHVIWTPSGNFFSVN